MNIQTKRSGVYDYARVEVDPVTFQVIHHRLNSIIDEQGATLSAISGSPLVNEATDYNTGIFRANGELVAMGKTVLLHAASVATMVKHIIADCEVSPGIAPGDMFWSTTPTRVRCTRRTWGWWRRSSTTGSASAGSASAVTSSTWAAWRPAGPSPRPWTCVRRAS
jgi:N-methylhydantoinase B/acetone carboxylase, alpha subunit